MQNDKPKKNTIVEMLNQLGDYATLEEVSRIIGDVIKSFGEANNITNTRLKDIKDKTVIIEQQVITTAERLSKRIDESVNKLSTVTENNLQSEIKNLKKLVADLETKIPNETKIDEQSIIDKAVAQAEAKIEIPDQLLGEDIRNALEALNGDDRLDVSAIKGLQELLAQLPKGEQQRIMAANRFLYEMLDVDVAGIVIGQSIKWDGIRWIPYTPAGGSSISVYGETPTDSGDQTNFTLAHTPVTGTLRLYRGGAYQKLGTDYTLSTNTITLSTVLESGSILQVDYQY